MCVIPNNIYVFTNHVGERRNFCKAEIAPFPYNSEIITNSEHGRTLFAPTVIWASPTSAKSLRSLRIYIALRARKAVQILYSDITFI